MPKWIIFVVAIALLTTAANVGLFLYRLKVPAAPVFNSKEFLKDREFTKAVKSIADGQGYVNESEVEDIVERCRIVIGGKIKCD